MFSNPTMHSFASPQIVSRRMSTVGPFMDSDHYFEEFQQALNSEPYFNFSNAVGFPFDSPMPLPLHRATSQVQASQAMPAPSVPTPNVRTQQYPTSTLRTSDLDPLFDNNGIYDFFYDSNPSAYRPPSEIPFNNYYNPNSNNNSRASPPRMSPQYPNMYPAATKRPMDNSMTINYSLQHATRTFHSNTQNAGYYQSRQTLPSVNSYANSNMYTQTYIQNPQTNAPLPTVTSIPTFAQSMPYASNLTDDQKASIPNSFVWENYIESVNNPLENPEDWSEGEDGSSSSYEISAEDAPLICTPASESEDGTESKKRRRGRISTKESNQPKKVAKLGHKPKTTIKKEESTSKKSSSTHKITATLLKSYPANSLNAIVVGTYTRAERVARIARYRVKRSQRRWEKKILYNCRKSFADKRPRVGGRFVKMS